MSETRQLIIFLMLLWCALGTFYNTIQVTALRIQIEDTP